MLNGKATVFLSCSDKRKEEIARPVRDALAEHDVYAVIVSDEPMLPRISGDPDSKVEAYLDGSDAFVALCTADNKLEGGTIECRQNIIDEIRRALTKPHLRSRVQVFKESAVHLPSNLNITYEGLDVDTVSPLVEVIVRQLRTWGIIGSQPERARALSTKPPATVVELIDGLRLGDHDEATRRAYRLLRTESRDAREATVQELRQFLRDTPSEGTDAVHRASSVLEAINRLDPSLVELDLIEELARSDDFTKRSSAAMLLWDRAEIAPADVPLGLLGRLALPSTEDWYVQSPAMAAVKVLLLRRRSARVILDNLANSKDAEDRYAVAAALLDVARIDRWAAPRDLAEKLSTDVDELVAAKGREALEAIGERDDDSHDPLSPFGM